MLHRIHRPHDGEIRPGPEFGFPRRCHREFIASSYRNNPAAPTRTIDVRERPAGEWTVFCDPRLKHLPRDPVYLREILKRAARFLRLILDYREHKSAKQYEVKNPA